MVRIMPRIEFLIDIVVIYKRRVATTIDKVTGIFARNHVNRFSAVENLRRCGMHVLGETRNSDFLIRYWSERTRNDVVSEFPKRVITGAISITENVNNGSVTSRIDIGFTTHEFWRDIITTHILDCRGLRHFSIHLAKSVRAGVFRHVDDGFRKQDMISECPARIVTGTVDIMEGVSPRTLAVDRSLRNYHRVNGHQRIIAAGIGNDRQRRQHSKIHAVDRVRRIHRCDGERGRTVDDYRLRNGFRLATRICKDIGTAYFDSAIIRQDLVRRGQRQTIHRGAVVLNANSRICLIEINNRGICGRSACCGASRLGQSGKLTRNHRTERVQRMY